MRECGSELGSLAPTELGVGWVPGAEEAEAVGDLGLAIQSV